MLHPAFRKVTSATFYGPDTHLFNPRAIGHRQVRAVGSYLSSAAPSGVRNHMTAIARVRVVVISLASAPGLAQKRSSM